MRSISLLISLAILLLPIKSIADSHSPYELGLRGGQEGRNSSLDENYDTAELYLLKDLPWKTALGRRTSLYSRFDLGVTYLNAANEESAMLAVGADLVLDFWDGFMKYEVGFRPTWMFKHEFGKDDFGGGTQFTSHAGLAFTWKNVALSFRFQHTSNAGLYDHNPGLNLKMFGLGYRF